MRISDWSSDVCSSDLLESDQHLEACIAHGVADARLGHRVDRRVLVPGPAFPRDLLLNVGRKNGCASDHPALRGTGYLLAVLLFGEIDGHLPKLLGNQRSEEHTSETQSLMRVSNAVLCLTKRKPRSSLHQ